MVPENVSEQTPIGERTTVLIVDDEEFNRDILIEFLEEAGYRVIVAVNGQQAFDQLEAHPETDLVVLDRMMPDLDGLEVLKRIKSHPGQRDLHVIMQTAAAASHQIVEGIRAGAFYYLTKPYQKELLLTIVATACADLRQMREARQALVGRRRMLLGLMDEARFRFRTLEEAKSLAHLVAECCPDSARVVYGLSELMINAIEHGNLGITYAEKTALMRSGAWNQEVERRLDLPENRDKFAELKFEARSQDVLIVIRDQGPGFHWREYLEISPRRASDPNGRGVAMARAISFSSLDYRGSGNEVGCVVLRDAPKIA